MKKSLELRQQRAAIIAQMQDIYKRADSAGNFAGEDETQWQRLDGEVKALDSAITRAEQMEALNDSLNTNPQNEIRNDPSKSNDPVEERARQEAAYEKAFRSYLTNRPQDISVDEVRSLKEYRGTNTQVVGTPGLGGYLVPEVWSNELIRYMKYYGAMLDVSKIITTQTGGTMNFPYIDDTSNIGGIIGEGTASAKLDMTVANKTLSAFTYTSYTVALSYELIQDDGYNLMGQLSSFLGERLGRKRNADYTTGAGTTLPYGVVTRAANSSVTTSAVSRTKILDLIHSVDIAYRSKGRLMFTDATFALIRKLAIGSGDDRPLWVPSMRDGVPDMIEGVPYTINNDMAELGAGNKFMLFGDFDQYVIREVLGIQIESSWEAFFGSRTVGFNAYLRSDADLIGNTAAIKYMAGA